MDRAKYLSEVLDVSQITKSSKRKFCIISGVGSGKNYFVEKILRGFGNILYISSRRAKVDEILANQDFDERIDWRKEVDDVVTTTNYGIERMSKNEKFSTTGFRNAIEHFAYVVVDEAHSIFSDATYTDSSFYVLKFLEHIEEHYKNIKIILMTGTPEPLQQMLKTQAMKGKEKYEIFDCRDKCINVMPKSIRIISLEMAVECMNNIPEGEKTIYYSTSATRLVKGDKAIYKQLNIPRESIAICMGNDSIKKLSGSIKNLSLSKECKQLREFVINNNRLPDEKKILLTTSTLKEGINILEDDIKIAFCESHVLTDIQQFAGRVRNGLDILYIIDDKKVKQHIPTFKEMRLAKLQVLLSFPTGDFLKSINDFYKKEIMNPVSNIYKVIEYDSVPLELYTLFMEEDFSPYNAAGEACNDYIEMIQKQNDYIRYNHLKKVFETYANRSAETQRLFREFHGELWEEKLIEFAQNNNIEYIRLVEKDKEEEVDIQALEEYLESVVGEPFPNEAGRNEMVDEVREFLHSGKNRKIGKINETLEKLGLSYEIKPIQSEKKKRNYRVMRKN